MLSTAYEGERSSSMRKRAVRGVLVVDQPLPGGRRNVDQQIDVRGHPQVLSLGQQARLRLPAANYRHGTEDIAGSRVSRRPRRVVPDGSEQSAEYGYVRRGVTGTLS
jgi:hypothetical protein